MQNKYDTMKERILPTLLLAVVSGALLFIPARGSVQTTSQQNAFAVRVVENKLRYDAKGAVIDGEWSAAVWYKRQCDRGIFTNCQTPQPIIVDGYDGVRVGNTVYVNAANLAAAKLFMNIYVFSLVENAGPIGQDIFNQVLSNVRFNTNIADVDARAELRRDTRRRTAMRDMTTVLDEYASVKRCSITQTKLCRREEECPGEETCGEYYPILQSGSYVRGVSFSSWPSWNTVLGATLKTTLPDNASKALLSQDPKNANRMIFKQLQFVGCVDPYDRSTCWNEQKQKMACPLKSYVFGYRSQKNAKGEPSLYHLGTTYEFTEENGSDDWSKDNPILDSVFAGICETLPGMTDYDQDDVVDREDNCKPTKACETVAGQCDETKKKCMEDTEKILDKVQKKSAKMKCESDRAACMSATAVDDACKGTRDPQQRDQDGDGIGDLCDIHACQPVDITADGSNLVNKTEFSKTLFDQWNGWEKKLPGVTKPTPPSDFVAQPGSLQRGQTQYVFMANDPQNDVDKDCVVGPVEKCPADPNVDNDPDGDGIDSACDTTFNGDATRSGICGNRRKDGRLPPFNTAAEECDWGKWNDQCFPSYGQQCWVCTSECKAEPRFGAYCGNGILEEGEQCDPGDIQGSVKYPAGVTCTPGGALRCGASSGPIKQRCKASCTDGGLAGYPVKGSAWNANIGWITMDPAQAGVVVNMYDELVGSAWNWNVGWIHMTPSIDPERYLPSARSEIKVDPVTGKVTGKAFGDAVLGGTNLGEQKWLGEILFGDKNEPRAWNTKVNPTTGQFSGFAWAPGKVGGTGGWMSFETAQGNVRTDWRAKKF